MGKRKVSDIQRLIVFAMSVTEGELNQVVETVAAIKAARFPVAVKPARAKRRDAGTKRGGEGKANGEASSVEAS